MVGYCGPDAAAAAADDDDVLWAPPPRVVGWLPILRQVVAFYLYPHHLSTLPSLTVHHHFAD